MSFLQHVRERYTDDTVCYQYLVAVYMYELAYNTLAREYCESRKLTKEVQELFQIGYAPSAAAQFGHFRVSSMPANFLERNGIAYPDTQYCKFVDRIMFPFHDLRGHVVGMTGRVFGENVDTSVRKYVHTQNTSVYQKALYLYGLYQALPFIKQSGSVVIVEGNVDVLSLVGRGIRNVVGCSGTAFGEQYLHMLSTVADRFLFWFDNDEAGEEGWNRAEIMCEEYGVPCGRVLQEIGHDPDAVSCIVPVDDIHLLIRKAYDQTC